MTMTNNGEFIMPRFRLALAAGAILLGAVSAASAADLPGPPPAYPPPQAPATYIPVAPVFSWTGFYLGANAGYGWSSGSGSYTAIPPGTFSASGNAFEGGGQLGYNYQFGGGFVLGAEADFQGNFGSGGTLTLTPGGSATAKVPWFGTARGRLGYAWDRVLLYATGGGAFGNSTLSGPGFSNSATYWTWTVGAGAEWAFAGPWSAKVEYLYAGAPSSVPAFPGVTGMSGSVSTNLVRAGINYHF
jgi:outer membrane immunogenic protein